MVLRLSVKTTEDGKEYLYANIGIGSGLQKRPTFMLWVPQRFAITNEDGEFFLKLPLKGCNIRRGKAPRSLILQNGDKNLFIHTVECGYRGSSSITSVTPKGEMEEYFYEYASPRGSLGISKGFLVLTDATKVVFSWSRDGRLYGEPAEGRTLLHLDGTVQDLEFELEDEDLALL